VRAVAVRRVAYGEATVGVLVFAIADPRGMLGVPAETAADRGGAMPQRSQ
jgi:hypothetical protein